MNKIYIGLVLTVFLVGCGNQTPVSDQEIGQVQEEKSNKMIIEETQDGSAQKQKLSDFSQNVHGYYILDGYLWKDGKQIAKSLESNLELSVWHVLKTKNETRIYVKWGGGCGGCVGLDHRYYVVNNVTGAVEIKEFKDYYLSYLFERGTINSIFLSEQNENDGNSTPTQTIISPDDTKVLFVKASSVDDGFSEAEPQTIWVYNLLTGEEEKNATVKEGYSVMKTEEGSIWKWLDSDLVSWKANSQDIQIKVPHDYANSKQTEHSFSSTEKFGMEPGHKPHAFDFDGDGIDEYVAYHKKKLEKPVSTRYGDKTDWNGAFRIYQWQDDRWVSVFEDEGTVGKEGYGVYSLMVEDEFFSIIDLDQDGIEEVKIETTQDGSGSYRNTYILKWDGEKITKAEMKDSKNLQQLEQEFLSERETFGPAGLDYISICVDDGGWCTFKQSAPNAIGKIVKKFEYQDGKFVTIIYEREDY